MYISYIHVHMTLYINITHSTTHVVIVVRVIVCLLVLVDPGRLEIDLMSAGPKSMADPLSSSWSF